jgi:hypothetical protein
VPKYGFCGKVPLFGIVILAAYKYIWHSFGVLTAPVDEDFIRLGYDIAYIGPCRLVFGCHFIRGAYCHPFWGSPGRVIFTLNWVLYRV